MTKHKKICTLLLVLIILFSNINTLVVNATEPFSGTTSPILDPETKVTLAGKKAEAIDEDEGRYKITVSVPGETKQILHNEVILMLDASDSQGANWTSVKESIMSIGKTVLPQTIENTDKAVMAVTVMGFGVSGKTVLEDVFSVEDLEKKLNALPSNDAFLNGQSATNCEVGFTHIKDYIENHNDKLKNAYVIYVSDGRSNASEEPVAYQNWQENPSWWFGGYRDLEKLVKFLFKGGVVQGHNFDGEFYWLLDNKNTVDATDKILGYTRENIIEKFLEKTTVETKLTQLEQTLASSTDSEQLQNLTLQKETWEKILSRFIVDGENTKYVFNDTTDEEEQLLIDLLKEDINSLFNKMWTDMSEIIDTTNLRTGEKVQWPKWRVWIDNVWNDVYEYSNLNYQTGTYPASVVEGAFLKYDKDFCGHTVRWTEHISLPFYFAYLGYPSPDKYNNAKYAGLRAALACDELASMEQVDKIYLLGYGSWSNDSWMNPNRKTKYETENYVKATNAYFYNSSSITAISESLKNIIPDIVVTAHTNVKITDYMSKLVRLDLDSIRIYKDDVCICRYTYDEKTGKGTHEWLISDSERPTEQIPITVTVVKATDYSLGGNDVIGNTNGDIYKIIWQVKDDTLLVSDRYSLVYEVVIDSNEKGFEAGKTYPTNGNTFAEYIDPVGTSKTEEVYIPTVSTKKDNTILPNENTVSNEIINNNTIDNTTNTSIGNNSSVGGVSTPSTENTGSTSTTSTSANQNPVTSKTPQTGDTRFNVILSLLIVASIIFVSTIIIEIKMKRK